MSFHFNFKKVLIANCAALLTSIACAQADELSEGRVANYVYANYLGSGYYRVDDQDVAIVNLPFSLDREDAQPYQSRWRLPVSMGFYDFNVDLDAIEDTEVPESVDTLSFVPGLEWTIPLNERLQLVPYVDLGVAANFSTEEEVLVYSAGVSSIYSFGKQRQHQWINRVLYAGDRSFSTKEKGGYASIQTGVDWRSPLGFSLAEREYHLHSFAMASWHINEIELIETEVQSATLTNSFEVGLTLMTPQPWTVTWFELGQVGLGYRFGDGLKAWRLVFGLPI